MALAEHDPIYKNKTKNKNILFVEDYTILANEKRTLYSKTTKFTYIHALETSTYALHFCLTSGQYEPKSLNLKNEVTTKFWGVFAPLIGPEKAELG